MFKKFLASMAIVAMFVTSTASAYTQNGDISGGTSTGGTSDGPIVDMTISDHTIDPSQAESTEISVLLSEATNLYLYVIPEDDTTITHIFIDDVPVSSGVHTYTWFGTEGNFNGGIELEDGVYKVKAFAFTSGGMLLDWEFDDITIDNDGTVEPPVFGDAPDVVGLNVVPSTFDPTDNEDTTITFSVTEDANVTVVVEDNGVVVREFSSYDGDFYLDGSHSFDWNGRDDNGFIVSDDVYTVRVTAQNADGSDVAVDTVVVDTDGITPPNPSGDIITDLDLNPTPTWDPTDDELEIEFDLEEDVDDLTVTAIRGGKEIELEDERNADADDYFFEWDGTDEDGDYVEAGVWQIVVETDGDDDIATASVTVEYERPEIIEAFVTKTTFDPTIGEFTYLVFKVDTNAVVTVEVYDGNNRVERLMEDDDVRKNRWYAIQWDGTEDGDEVDEGGYEFRIRAENEVDDDIYDTDEVSVTVRDDEVSNSKSNATNDYTDPVIFDDNVNNNIEFHYCIDEDADVYLAVYDGTSTSGSPEAELLDYVAQSEGCHTVTWTNVEDDDGRDLKDDVYSWKLITRTSSTSKDTETGRFVVGNGEEDVDDDNPKPNPPSGDCDASRYWDISGVSPELCQAITWATDEGIFSGYSDGSFRPYNNINRAEVLKVVFEAFRDDVTMLPANGGNLGFSDVDPNAWYMTYARTAKFYGMLHGYLNSTQARLNNTINRAEFLKFALEASDAFTAWEVPGYERSYYADVLGSEPTHDWFFDYAGVAYNLKLYKEYYDAASGQIYLEPGQMVQRGEVALLLYKMANNGLLD